jgi:hypothetical protein
MSRVVGDDRTLSHMGDSRWAGIGGLAAVGGLALGLAVVVGSGKPEWHWWLFAVLVVIAIATLLLALAWTTVLAVKPLSSWWRARQGKEAVAERGEEGAVSRATTEDVAGSGTRKLAAGRERHASGRTRLPRLAVVSACAAIIVSVAIAANHLVSGTGAHPGASGGTSAHPASGPGGLVYELMFPLKPAGQFTEISLDYGGKTLGVRYVDATYLRAQLSYLPELGLDDPYTLDVSAANAGKEACATALIQDQSKSNQIVKLHQGLLFCVRTTLGIALLEVTENIGGSGTLHLRETYWPNRGS